MTIVAGWAPGPEGEAALDTAAAEASRTGQQLVVAVHASVGGEERRREDLVDNDGAPTARGRELLERLKGQGVTARLEADTSPADPASHLLDLALVHDASLIVIGIRRRSAVGKLVLGSVSQDVLLHANCPVLAVKPPVRG